MVNNLPAGRIAVALATGLAAATPAAASTSYFNLAEAYAYGSGIAGDEVLNRTNDGSAAVAVNAGGDGYAAGSASSLNNGTATATAASANTDVHANGLTVLGTSFDFSPATAGRVTLRISGWANATGSADASVQTQIVLSNGIDAQDFDSPLVYSGNPGNAPVVAGLRRLSFVKTLNWVGGDTLTVENFAFASVAGDGTPGYAAAYIDPTLTITAGVPEPAAWAMLVAGFGLVGSALRRRTAAAA